MSVESDKKTVESLDRQVGQVNSDGGLYFTTDKFSLLTTASRELGITPSGTKEVALSIVVRSNSPDYTLEVYEDQAYTAGVAQLVTSLNRVSANTATTEMKDDVTATLGTPIITVYRIGASGQGNMTDVGSEFDSSSRLILDTSKTYVFSITNNDTSTHDVTVEMQVAER